MKRSLLVIATCLLALRVTAQTVTSTTEMERQIFEWTNQERAKVNAPPLKWSDRLAVAARLHSDEMAKHKDLSHQLKGEPVFTERLAERRARFSAASENVGFSDDAETLQSGWMHSPGHRKNLLNPIYTEMGVGIVRSGDRLWATEDFATAVEDLSSEQFEQAVATEITALRKSRGLVPLKATTSSELRRLACSGETSASAAFGALPGRHLETYAYSFTAPKVSEIPQNLTKRILELPSAGYSIGACSAQRGNGGMSTYRVLLVLYR